MRTGICVGTKGDPDIIRLREWCNHYLNLGVDKIFLYDNNDLDGPNPMDALQGLEHYIEYHSIRGITERNRQWNSYTDCYNKHNKEYDWLMFVDDDEYLVLTEDNTIQEYLARPQFQDVDCIHINWKIYTSGDVFIEDPNIPLIEQYTEPLSPELENYPGVPYNNHIKTIVHCRGKQIYFNHPHFARTNQGVLTCVSGSGEPCQYAYPFSPQDYRLASLNHYQTRAVNIFCYKRLGERSKVMFDGYPFTPNKEIDRFFKFNRRTPEREDFIMKYCFDKHIRI